MKLYILVSGALFALVLLAHVARVILEGPHPLEEPIFIGATLASLGMAAWAAFLLLRAPRA